MRWLPVVAMLLLAGCQERSFDERYAEAEKTIRDKTQAIDAEIASEAALAEPDPLARESGPRPRHSAKLNQTIPAP